MHSCDKTVSRVWCDSFICMTLFTYVSDITHIHVCDTTHSYLSHDLFTRVTCRIQTWNMTNSCIWHASLISVTWLIHVWHVSWICINKLPNSTICTKLDPHSFPPPISPPPDEMNPNVKQQQKEVRLVKRTILSEQMANKQFIRNVLTDWDKVQHLCVSFSLSLALLVSLFLSICLSLFVARYMFEPRHVHERPKHHTHECVILPRRDSHVNICMSSIANMNEICHVHECMNKSCRTCEWATSYVWMSHATHTQIMKVCARASAVHPQ